MRLEVLLTDLGEVVTHDIADLEHPKGFSENMKVAKGTRDLYEKETKKSAISSKNALNYEYINDTKQIENE